MSKNFLCYLPVWFYFSWPSALPVIPMQCTIAVKIYTTFHDKKKCSFLSISIMLAEVLGINLFCRHTFFCGGDLLLFFVLWVLMKKCWIFFQVLFLKILGQLYVGIFSFILLKKKWFPVNEFEMLNLWCLPGIRPILSCSGTFLVVAPHLLELWGVFSASFASEWHWLKDLLMCVLWWHMAFLSS